ncbi:MAG: hypothetical protein ACSHX0_12885 [Akkermansiaceae bacterium]
MNLRCPYCGERIVARGFKKCPGCYENLPEELQLTQREKELDGLDEDLRRKRSELLDSGSQASSGGGDFPII